jgi:hypothetical protein
MRRSLVLLQQQSLAPTRSPLSLSPNLNSLSLRLSITAEGV